MECEFCTEAAVDSIDTAYGFRHLCTDCTEECDRISASIQRCANPSVIYQQKPRKTEQKNS